MRISLGSGTRRTVRKSKPMSPKQEAIFWTVSGVISIIATVFLIIYFANLDVPDDVQWYEGRVTNIISEYTDYKQKSDSKRGQIVYDCKVSIEYTVDGETYDCIRTFDDQSRPVAFGEVYYVKVSPSNPNRVYEVSTSKSSSDIFLYLVIGILAIAGIASLAMGISKLKKLKKEASIPVSENNDYIPVSENNNFIPAGEYIDFNNTGLNEEVDYDSYK